MYIAEIYPYSNLSRTNSQVAGIGCFYYTLVINSFIGDPDRRGMFYERYC